MADYKINNIKDFYKLIINSNVVNIMFKKKDNSRRLLNGTLNFDKIPSEDRPNKIDKKKIEENLKKGFLHIYDLDKKGWRTVIFNNSEWIEVVQKNDKIKYRITK